MPACISMHAEHAEHAFLCMSSVVSIFVWSKSVWLISGHFTFSFALKPPSRSGDWPLIKLNQISPMRRGEGGKEPRERGGRGRGGQQLGTREKSEILIRRMTSIFHLRPRLSLLESGNKIMIGIRVQSPQGFAAAAGYNSFSLLRRDNSLCNIPNAIKPVKFMECIYLEGNYFVFKASV